ncbi:hypothetical protein C2845_PM14G07370 [Panicum miliaceum]|uniref:Uncharacterized protein n=1 Tax=Panicum miliaceum TaxID=4540 RepID=A0A3L6PR82_PANMI|nr:hypothetical protein C2845_PM14G07370 [Panicum miliaceum]
MTGKRKHSKILTELSNRLCRKGSDSNQKVTMIRLSRQTVLEPECASSEKIVLANECAGKCSEEDMHFKPCMSSVQAMEGHEKQSSTSCSFSVGRVQMSTSYVVNSDMEKRWATSTAEEETTYETSYDVSRKGTVPLTRSMFDHSVQPDLKDANGPSKNDKQAFPPTFPFQRCSDRAQEVQDKTGMYRDLCAEQNTACVNQWQDIMLENPVMDKDAEWDIENCRISGSVKTSEHHGSVRERDEPNKDTSRGNGERNGMFDSLTVVTDTEEDGYVRVGGHGAVYGGRTLGSSCQVSFRLPVRYASHPEAHLAWRQTYNDTINQEAGLCCHIPTARQ